MKPVKSLKICYAESPMNTVFTDQECTKRMLVRTIWHLQNAGSVAQKRSEKRSKSSFSTFAATLDIWIICLKTITLFCLLLIQSFLTFLQLFMNSSGICLKTIHIQ